MSGADFLKAEEYVDPPYGGDQRRALDNLFSLAYEELRRLASAVKRSDAHASISPTTLVNEAWIKLAGSPGAAVDSKLHFKRIAARAMRQLLVEAARRKHADKRGGDFIRVTFDESAGYVAEGRNDVLELDAALDELARLNPRQSSIVENRFFGGLEVQEIAELLGVSEATVLRDWRTAKAWLGAQLRPRPRESGGAVAALSE